MIHILDRNLKLSRDKNKIIPKENKVIILEGNKILLKNQNWNELHKFFNSTIKITSKHEVLEKRLVERWRSFNISEEEIKQKVYENDLPNGVNVYKNSIQANYKLLN